MENSNKKGIRVMPDLIKTKAFFTKYAVLPVLILLIVIASLISDVFLTENNLLNVLRQVAANGIISIGLTYVVLTGGIDISVGSVVGVSSILFASCFQPEGFVSPYSALVEFLHQLIPGDPVLGVIVAALIVMVICAGLGYVNGVGVCKGNLPPFIMTMGTLTLFRGVALLVSNGHPLYMSAEYGEMLSWLGTGRVLNIPAPVIVLVIVTVIAWVVLSKTVYGRYIRAIGGNEESARVAGIRVDRYKMSVYAISSGLAALAGVLITCRTATGEPMLGESYEMDAIAATVIGGTVLSGGVGTVIGTVLGVLIIGVINNMLNLANVSTYFQYIVKGLIIIFAVLLRTDKKRK